MGDTASFTSVDIAAEDKREPLLRQVYVALRLKELVADLQSLVSERQSLNAMLTGRGSESSKDVRKMRERRGYIAIRINVLRAEQQGLVAEKEALPPIVGSQDGGGKKKKNPA